MFVNARPQYESEHTIPRVILIIFNLGVWHHLANGFATCKLHSWFTIGLLTLQLLYALFMPPRFLPALCNILLGAHLLMAIKPRDWYFSYEWDCGELYDTSNTVSRAAMLGYASIVVSTETVMHYVWQYVKGPSLPFCRKIVGGWVWLWFTFTNRTIYVIILAEISIIVFGICYIMVIIN